MSTSNEDLMSPDASPGDKSDRSGVRRVNNVPLYILGGGLAMFLLIMLLVASDRAEQQNAPTQAVAQQKAGNTTMFAKEIAGNRQDGIVQAKTPQLVPPTTDAPGSVLIATPPANLDVPPAPPTSSGMQPPTSEQQQMAQMQAPQRSMADEQAERIRTMKLQQFDEAVKAKSGMPFAPPRSSASSQGTSMAATNTGAPATREETLARIAAVRQQLDAATRDDPTAAYKARLQQMEAAGVGGGASSASGAGAGQGGEFGGAPKLMQASASRNNVAQFAGSGQGDRWRLDAKPEAPRSPYELRAGFVIPATLISGINSELPGQIIAQVSQDVFDTPRGQYKLIPQGSRLVGAYTSEVAYGQSSILVGWQRIIFPDGKAMDIGSMPGADSAGYAGLRDQVNNHYFRLFGSAFLMSGVTAGIALSQPDQGINSRPTASSAMSEALGQQLGQVTAQIISKNLNISPTIEIRPGYRFNVMVTKDMTFSKPYKAFDY